MAQYLKWISICSVSLFLFYGSIVLSNLISFKQRLYANELAMHNVTLRPLDDVLFHDLFQVYDIPVPLQLSLIAAVDVLTSIWCVLCVFIWILSSRNAKPVANLLAAELLLVPTFGLAQWLTVVPDSQPNCLEVSSIPSVETMGWVFYRVSLRSCGDMLYSSALAQMILFSYFADSIVKITCCKSFLRFVSFVWTVVVIAVALAARYQYSMDMLLTVVVTMLVANHPIVHIIGRGCFTKRHLENGSRVEKQPLNNVEDLEMVNNKI